MRLSMQLWLCAVAIALFISDACFSQEREPPRRGDGPRGEAQQPFGFRLRMLALQETLDKDKDGKLSADEIKTAPEALKTLDKNNDGKLSADEIGWPPRLDGPGGPGRGGPFGGRFGGRGQGGAQAPVGFANRLMSRDVNSDGKVAADELPKSMRRVIERADQDGDGAVDETEAKQFAESYAAIGRTERPAQPAAAKQ